ncbi:uncharacterized protein Z518_08490 [Rhinocladiella mackenziei CBS 650.93]|uniref:Short-chain dehydrogenase/reductase 3 n=1 Tax=Rhinocladiella mackenziei CBS 650.93 TaxID=1442369 RepID=A0A0D2I9M7_9EURO|nr:uncharacterized protein Z518_08490 [Rhinocladiella mackenziei CBS 650.93]KIX02549.1 hypothetical protein Z518_08490 [Rhinocladiella mackenziei CBS 650.93]
MSSSVQMIARSWSLQPLARFSESVFSHTPEGAHNFFRSRLVQTGLAALLVLRLLKSISNQLSWYSMNNYTRLAPWDPDRELVLITGGSSGIGEQIMKDLAKQKVTVIILDIQEPRSRLPPGVFFYKADVTSRESVKAVAEVIRKDHRDPTILINNAGVGYGRTIIEEPEEMIRLTFEVNILAHFWTVKEFLPSMVRHNHGHIITIASLASFAALGEAVDYACTKAGALAFHEGLTQEIRHWYKAKNIRTSIIHPLWVRTQMIDDLVKAGKHFRQRILSPDDVSRAVLKQIITQSSGQIIIPSSHQPATMLRAFPQWLQEYLRNKNSQDLIRVRALRRSSNGDI